MLTEPIYISTPILLLLSFDASMSIIFIVVVLCCIVYIACGWRMRSGDGS